jgi:hypothetical protein
MLMLNHAEKADMWGLISLCLAVIDGILVFNQMTPPAVDALIPTILPCWVLGLSLSLTLLSGYNSIRHTIKNKRQSKKFRVVAF